MSRPKKLRKHGHYVITSNLTCVACSTAHNSQDHTCITPEAVYGVWSYASEEWSHQRQLPLEKHFMRLDCIDKMDSIRIYRSRIRNSTEGGGVSYEPVTLKSIQMNDWIGMVMGHIARFWYCGWTPTVGKEINRQSISSSLIQRLRELSESCEVLSKICEQAHQTAVALNKRSSTLKSDRVMDIREREELRQLAKTLLELESLVDRLVKIHPDLSAFSQMSKVRMHNLTGTHLTDLSKETAAFYRQLNEGIQIYKDWIKFTLALAKPVAIQSGQLTALDTAHRPLEPHL